MAKSFSCGLLVASLLGAAEAHSTYMSSIPNGMKVTKDGLNWYGVGHTNYMGGGENNAFGVAFAAAGHEWTTELCNADSDGDGQSNGLELGDPDCVWTAGADPARTEDISHPAYADSVTSAGPTAAGTTTAAAAAAPEVATTTTEPPTEAPTTQAPAPATTAEAPAPASTTDAPAPEVPAPATTTEAPAPEAPETTAKPEPIATTTEEAAPEAPATTVAPAPVTTTEAEEPYLELSGCSFSIPPATPGFYWDESCWMGALGCFADGKHVQCRFCGGESVYAEIACPPTTCSFENEPFVQYYWDENCESGMLGCWADGVHPQCRWCGETPYTSVECPANAGGRTRPTAPPGVASGTCHFPNEPAVPYYWDENCAMGKLGCMADGINPECRFCDHRPFESIPCPDSVAPPKNRCYFPKNSEPKDLYYWDETCVLGTLGCWADNINAECRFCGGTGVYRNVSCPTDMSTGAAESATEEGSASATADRATVGGRTSGEVNVAKDVEKEEVEGGTIDLSGAPANVGSSSVLLIFSLCCLVALGSS